MAGTHFALAGVAQEPCPPLGFIDSDVDEAGSRDVAVLIADVVSLAEARRQRLIVLAQLGQHVLRLDVLSIIVGDAL